MVSVWPFIAPQRSRRSRGAKPKNRSCRAAAIAVAQQLGVDLDKVTLEASFVDDLGADSLDVVELVMAFEEEFGVEIPDEAAEKIATVKNAVDYLSQNLES